MPGKAQLEMDSVTFNGASIPAERLSQIRKWKKKTQDDVFNKIMNASTAADTELRAWRLSLSERLNMDKENRKAAQENEHATQAEMLCIMRDQSDMLRHLVALQEEQRQARLPLQPLQNSTDALFPCPHPQAF